MLEYCDTESRKKILGIIYTEYVKEKKKHIRYGITSIDAIVDWENFRYKWLSENIISELEKIKDGK